MKPSSSRSEALLRPLSGTPDVDAELDDRALLQALLDAEAALARAAADTGLLPVPVAEEIARHCRAERYDPAALGAAADAAGNPVVPLVRELTAAVDASARPWVHHGATSQDILDTALSLVAVRAGAVLLRQLDAAADAAADLARVHRDTLMVARTLGQQAAPTTFGLKAAGWLLGLDEARTRLARARAALPAQLGGAVGTLAGYGPAGPDLVDRFAAQLGLAASPLPWHTRRQPVLDLAAALGGLLAATGKIAIDVGLLAQTEIGEVTEGGEGRGGSSAMPHKRNPVDSVLVTAAARRGPGLVGTLFTAAVQEHERATGGWHAEWEPLGDLLHLAGGAAARTARMLAGLRVHPERMRANLDATGGLLLAEAVATRLAPALGRAAAHDLVRRAAARPPLRDALLAEPDVRAHLSEADLDAALDPAGWLGSAGHLVDRALDLHRDGSR
ncbi:3-carboxy-cis,cis-muconate cycloisomerase [Micromonospora endophytica]|uniref:3-carboxy-cis,cis-muconate cycloisomerase n=1 Tax=Micromonospora endophytica TaxID=515350 RepID=A0A2W2DP50_9ACTN|nr:3-carboxy-cis,cis-muconate cycloisomerase [Micromonospora endophytica]PZF98906.1 3-carboxy-cis,cis-muconate cycloisomerase [Micromonospora endophytica]RIW44357.1 3-carboxy-cis,cis-muconate cycloisomerase [Micromonospora endophytica]BCJ62445.1 3-carboxy-cis,cis-muconate cycloisomerase [Micromonospora endophytica]